MPERNRIPALINRLHNDGREAKYSGKYLPMKSRNAKFSQRKAEQNREREGHSSSTARERERETERHRECGKKNVICSVDMLVPSTFCLLLLTCLHYRLYASAKPHPCKAVKQF